MADLDASPPEPLLMGLLEPADCTLLYGNGGVGKGTVGAWLIVELQRSVGLRTAIFDAEGTEGEWASRVAGLGGDPSVAFYLNAEDIGKDAGRPIYDCGDGLAEYIALHSIGLLIIDSVLTACMAEADRAKSDPQMPWTYVRAMRKLGIPVLAFHHSPSGSDKPFGSVMWLNAHRNVIHATKAEGDGHQVRLAGVKRNRRRATAAIRLTVLYDDDNTPIEVLRTDDKVSTNEWIDANVPWHPESVSMSDLEDVYRDQQGDVPAHELDKFRGRLGRALNRRAKDGDVSKTGGTSNARWSRR